jgi:hypothetical protein
MADNLGARRMRLSVTVALIAMTAIAGRLGAQASGAVLSLPASTRAAGAADAAPFASGADALFYGAARLPRERAVATSAGSWIGGAQFAALALSMPVQRVTVALGVQSLDYGTADEIVPDPLTGGTTGQATGDRVGASEFAATMGMNAQFGAFESGVTFGFLHQQLADVSTSAMLASFGESYAWRGWILGGSSEGGLTPLRYGTRRYTPESVVRGNVESPGWRVLSGVVRGVSEYRSSASEGRRIVVGAEGEWDARSGWQLSLRAAGARQSAETARAPWSAGGSAARGGWSLDYAYQGYGPLGAVHRMGVTWHSRAQQSPSR